MPMMAWLHAAMGHRTIAYGGGLRTERRKPAHLPGVVDIMTHENAA